MSESRSIAERKYRYVFFHGEDVRTKKFQKKINRKPTLKYVILGNSIILLGSIYILWLLINLFS